MRLKICSCLSRRQDWGCAAHSMVSMVRDGIRIRTDWFLAAGPRLPPVDQSSLGLLSPQSFFCTEICCASVVITSVHALVKMSGVTELYTSC